MPRPQILVGCLVVLLPLAPAAAEQPQLALCPLLQTYGTIPSYALTRWQNNADESAALRRDLHSSEYTIRQKALNQLQRLAWDGRHHAIDLLLEYVAGLPINEAAQSADAVSKVNDRRAVLLLIDLLENARDRSPHACKKILQALGQTRDPRAVEPVLQLVLAGNESTERHAARTLVVLDGAAAVQPQLLRRLIDEPSRNDRQVLREVIASIGGAALPQELAKVLPLVVAADVDPDGPQRDILLLMEKFPDPAAQPILRKLLQADNQDTRLQAAQSLARLGDTSGVNVLLADLMTDRSFGSYEHYEQFNQRIGKAIKGIAAPRTRESLIDLYMQKIARHEKQILQVMVYQADPGLLPLLAQRLGDSDAHTRRHVAHAIASILPGLPGATEFDIASWKDADNAEVADAMFHWAFRDQRPGSDDIKYPDHDVLTNMSGAIVEVGGRAFLQFSTGSGTWQTTVDNALIDAARSKEEREWAFGSLTAIQSHGYLAVMLRLDWGWAGYLFRASESSWEPVNTTDNQIQ